MSTTSLHSLHKAFGDFIPVWALSREIPEPIPHIPTPDIGIRWGRPADFQLTTGSDGNQRIPREPQDKDEDPPPDINVIKSVNMNVSSQGVKVTDSDLGGEDQKMYIALRRAHNISFHFTQTLDQLPNQRWHSITWSYNLGLVLHPEDPPERVT